MKKSLIGIVIAVVLLVGAGVGALLIARSDVASGPSTSRALGEGVSSPALDDCESQLKAINSELTLILDVSAMQGAYENRLASTLTGLQAMAESLNAPVSRIREPSYSSNGALSRIRAGADEVPMGMMPMSWLTDPSSIPTDATNNPALFAGRVTSADVEELLQRYRFDRPAGATVQEQRAKLEQLSADIGAALGRIGQWFIDSDIYAAELHARKDAILQNCEV